MLKVKIHNAIITKEKYAMLSEGQKKYYRECDLCFNYFILNVGGSYDKDNNIYVCDTCVIRPKNLLN